MQHAPIGNPYAGASVPKVVYVSRNTPLMAAVKRVRKLLQQVEKRAMKNVKLVGGRGGDKEKMERLAEGSKKAREEKVYVKATGMAMGQALKVGQWFREKEKELAVNVEVNTGSVIVVDDIVELDEDDAKSEEGTTTLEGGNVIMDDDIPPQQGQTTEEAGPVATTTETEAKTTHNGQDEDLSKPSTNQEQPEPTTKKRSSRASRRRKKRPTYDKEDVPEARTRWVKMVEVAISLKG